MSDRCDCQNPDGPPGVRHVSMDCPLHNDLPLVELSAEQLRIARHALGLPNGSRRSYRNRFVAGRHHASYADLVAMVEQGWAVRGPDKDARGKPLYVDGANLFMLTLEGARLALLAKESLDIEDFPTSA